MHCIEVYTKKLLQNYFTNELFGSKGDEEVWENKILLTLGGKNNTVEMNFPFHFKFPSLQTSESKYQTQVFIKITFPSSPSPTIK